MPRVLCVGHVNWDVSLRLDHLPEPDGESAVRDTTQGGGGSAANVAVGLAGLDCAATLAGSVGDDEHGLLARRDLDRAGVDLAGLRTVAGETTTKYLLVDDAGEVSVLGAAGVNEALGPDDIDPALVAAADRVHLTAHRPDTLRRVAEVATEAGVPVSVDPGRRLADRDFSDVLALADTLFVNAVEARALDGPEVPVVVTKRGTEGATVTAPDDSYDHAGFDLPSVDSTGAGDAFAAGFLAARLRGDGAADALAVANACGALAAETEGPKTALSWEAVEAVLAGERA
ncbi:carbohydrate kinase family protein [Halosegnis marinus]|uniref:Carbohydrate kinase family protein n=1 Tax=Halosegnis marinus TaxID=3034023 RepID=A0ABD5ZLG4_9EURY|nr:PfkB family carbohydrate kinase [Halosegnis sp. DT85]